MLISWIGLGGLDLEIQTSLIDELESILYLGFEIGNAVLNIRQCAFVCDAPVKSLIKKTVNHRGYHSCHKCKDGTVTVKSERTRGFC